MKSLISRTLLLFCLSLFFSSAIVAQSTVKVTHADGSVHEFLIPAHVEQTFDILRSVRVKRADANPLTPNVPGAIISEEKNTGEILENIVLETFERAIQNPQFQFPSLRTKMEAAKASVEADQKKAVEDAKAEIKAAKKLKKAENDNQ